MITDKNSRRDLYYTNDHDWVDFHGAIAYVGTSAFKLTGFKDIHLLSLPQARGFITQGEVIATITYNEYQVEVKMPVDGKLLDLNESLTGSDQRLLLQYPESAGWLVKISPAQPYERKGLLLQKDYRMNGKNKFAKS